MIPGYDQEIEKQHEPAIINEAEPPEYDNEDSLNNR